ncbi:hypothetical protein ACLKA6_013034 [Drosophila palustris]
MDLDESKIFFGITLRPDRAVAYWNLSKDEDCRKLVISRMVLGAGANEDEYNVVELKTAEDDVIPIASLKADENRVAILDLEFFDSEVEFTLTAGSGPINILGHIVLYEAENISEMEKSDFSSRCL